MINEKMLLAGEVLAVKQNIKTGRQEFIFGKNIITNDGDQYYAEASVGSESWSVAGMRMGSDPASADVAKGDTDVNSFLAGTNKAIDAGYPKTDDDDSDNVSSVDIVTWRVSYAAGDANVNSISEVSLVDSHAGPVKALCHAVFAAPFNKTSDDTLKVFINHTFEGS
jgi:hypothetical protein